MKPCDPILSWLYASFECLALCYRRAHSSVSILFQACNRYPSQIVQTSFHARHLFILVHRRPHQRPLAPQHHRRRLGRVRHRPTFRSSIHYQFLLLSHLHRYCHPSSAASICGAYALSVSASEHGGSRAGFLRLYGLMGDLYLAVCSKS